MRSLNGLAFLCGKKYLLSLNFGKPTSLQNKARLCHFPMRFLGHVEQPDRNHHVVGLVCDNWNGAERGLILAFSVESQQLFMRLETMLWIRTAFPYGRCGHALFPLIFAMAISAGCQSGTYRAASLPLEYRTPTVANHASVNLARFSSSGLSNTQITRGDLLKVTISSGRDEEKLTPVLTRVSNDGTIDLSTIGLVRVAGLEPVEASKNIAVASVERGIYRKPNVTLSVQSKAMNKITILGEVAEPGLHEMPRSSCDLISVLGVAGGLTKDADTSIEIIRHNPEVFSKREIEVPMGPNRNAVSGHSNRAGDSEQQVSYADLGKPIPSGAQMDSMGIATTESEWIDLTDPSKHTPRDYHLHDRDVVLIHKRKQRLVYVMGLVKKPGQFNLPNNQDVHLLDAVALAGGLSSAVADKVLIIRHAEGDPQPLAIKASLNTAKNDGRENIRLAAGDTITIERTPATIIVDTFANIFRITMGVSGNTLAF